ncbi:hypothetical protein H6P81_020216 [Aristolochia fimbriata]|uniref:Protein RBL n=1 Tax=Aristolochia fimbriata TaxID=158543 RepID=A0AAV7DX31_ARIFI|nr:hypothetical protein H6P81_020216 [Aristolochia fimbriata]
MNTMIIDPLQGDFPEVIEEYLEHGIMKCIAFNRRGTLLAAGCADGSCVIWDFETRGIAKELRDSDRVAPITSVCWSKNGHNLLAAAADKSLTLWSVSTGEKVARATLQQTTLLARLHPSSTAPSICLACPLSSAPVLVDFNTGKTTDLPVSVSVAGPSTASHSRNKFGDGSLPYTPTPATFSKNGELIYVGNSKGEILIMDYLNVHVYGVVSVPGGALIKSMVFSRNGQYLLTNSNDRTLRIFENLLPSKGGVKALEKISKTLVGVQEVVDKLKMVGSKCLVLSREFQDSVTRSHWKAPCFSGDGEWVVGALASKGEHKIYIWGKAGNLVKILEGPKEALTDLAWHPEQPIIVSASLAGFVYIWAKEFAENWSAFAPDFKELEENEEYEEREDEFDLMPETVKVKESNTIEDEEVDILAVDKDSALSDSDLSQEELCFLPAIPSPDAPEQQEKYLGSSSQLEGCNRSRSPLSEEAEQNVQEENPGSSLFVGNSAAEEVATDGRVKRRRKPSEKGLELQAEKGRQPSTKKKCLAKNRKKSRGQENCAGRNEEPVTDEGN